MDKMILLAAYVQFLMTIRIAIKVMQNVTKILVMF